MDNPSTAKILFLDIETSPLLGYVWGKYDQTVSEFKKEWHILCVGYKWLGGKTQVLCLPDFGSERRLVKETWKLIDEADVVVAHNGDRFDIRKLNARFSFHDLSPPSPYRTIDTLKVARKYYGFTSNKLDDLARHLGLGKKVRHEGLQLWLDCMAGKEKAWSTMRRYNRQDVELLYKIYLRFLPWIDNYPLPSNGTCNRCGGKQIRSGYYINKSRKMARLKCKSCGGWALGKI